MDECIDGCTAGQAVVAVTRPKRMVVVVAPKRGSGCSRGSKSGCGRGAGEERAARSFLVF